MHSSGSIIAICENLGALLLAAGEALVEVAVGERLVHLQHRHALAHRPPEFARRKRRNVLAGLSARRAYRIRGHAQEVRHRDAGDRGRILEGEEEPALGAFVRPELQDVLALVEDLALVDLVVRVPGDSVGQGALAGAVLAHQRVDLATVDREADSLEDLGAVDAGMQVFNDKQRGLAHRLVRVLHLGVLAGRAYLAQPLNRSFSIDLLYQFVEKCGSSPVPGRRGRRQ